MPNELVQQKLNFSIVSANLTIQALRDSGYKSTDHALAELIDNSIDAEAKNVEVVCIEKRSHRPHARRRVSRIAVIDDGYGMDSDTLRRALKFGDGTNLNNTTTKIGRFGVGLPQSSISQCKRVDIWTWQNGPDNAYHCYLDLDEIQDLGIEVVPSPTRAPVPDEWRSGVSDIEFEASGTIVVWSDLDRVKWKMSRTTLNHTSNLVGRVYRWFIHENQVEINLIRARDCTSNGLERVEEYSCLPNDPLYLMTPSSTPSPYDNKSMFEQFNQNTFDIPIGEQIGQIRVTCSLVTEDFLKFATKNHANPGSTEWGRHAADNVGVSIVRAKRELELSQAWVNSYEPTERWWSVEVSFNPILDEYFGVVNNKQYAHEFTQGASFSWEQERYPGESELAHKDRLEDTGDRKFYLMPIWNHIKDQIKEMRRKREQYMKYTRSPRHNETGRNPAREASKVIDNQRANSQEGKTDKAEPMDSVSKTELIVGVIQKNPDIDDRRARQWAQEIVDANLKVEIVPISPGHRNAFFVVEFVNNVLFVELNQEHPVYEHLIDVLESSYDDTSIGDLRESIEKANYFFRILLVAWARYEDKCSPKTRERLQDVRMDWGMEARKFIQEIEGNEE